MLIDIKNIIPVNSLPRYNCESRKWLLPLRFRIKETSKYCVVSYKTKRGTGNTTFHVKFPKKVEITPKFKCALVAYLCEGCNPLKGVYTDSSSNKGRQITTINSDFWILKLIINEFEKLGIDRERWKVRLTIFKNMCGNIKKFWWHKKLKIPLDRFSKVNRIKGNPIKSSYNPQGRAQIELVSLVHAAIITKLFRLLMTHKFPNLVSKRELDMKKFIPKETLPRYNGIKCAFPAKLSVKNTLSSYIISYRGGNNRNFSEKVPKVLKLSENLLLALTAYLCEGRNPIKGINAIASGNRGREIEFTNSNYWLVKLIIDGFELFGINRKRWKCRLFLFDYMNKSKKVSYWINKLRLNSLQIRSVKILESNSTKMNYEPNGRISIFISSPIYTAILNKLLKEIKKGEFFKLLK